MPVHNYQTVLQKIKTMSAEFQFATLLGDNLEKIHPNVYVDLLNGFQTELLTAKRREDEYIKLEEQLQKEETSNRAKIAFEQQMKLYCDSLQDRLAQSEREKSKLLENSTQIIRSLKKTNQELFSRLHSQEAASNHKKNLVVESYRQYQWKPKAASLRKRDCSDPESSPREVHEIQKTETICPKTSRGNALKLKTKNVRSMRSISQGQDDKEKKTNFLQENGKTYQIGLKTDRQLLLRKKNRKKNQNITEFAKDHRKEMEEHLKSCYLRGQKKQRPTMRQRQKNVNRSVNSIASVGSEKAF